MTPAISIRNLKKVYKNGTVALQGVSLDILSGNFFALLGPNGAGKTTLISIVSGLTNKTEGSVSVFGHDTDQEPEKAKTRIGVVPQEFNFGIFENVEDIVFDQAGYYGLSRAQVRPSVEKYLRALGLWDKRKDQSRTLSGGMKRRLMIARALIHEPQLLILDEPTAGVDIELRRGMWDFLKGLSGEGRTIILTTHYLEEAEQLAKQVAIIHKGHIVEHGSIKELLSKMSMETFVLDVRSRIPGDIITHLKSFNVRAVDDTTIEITLMRGQTVNEAIGALSARGVEVMSMRNKTNRLEEYFLGITAA